MDALCDQRNLISMYSLNINIDGLPIFRSSSCSFWPIIVQLHELRNEIAPLIVGIFSGTSKHLSLAEISKLILIRVCVS